MPTIISESKLVYPEFKFFKNIYTSVNISPAIYFCADTRNETKLLEEVNFETPKVLLGFEADSPYYQLNGEITGESEFFKWLKTVDLVKITLSNINLIAKCLKKNAVSIEFKDAEYFAFNYIDKEDNIEKQIKIIPELYNPKGYNKDWFFTHYSLNNFSLNNVYSLSEDFLQGEICSIFRDNENKICKERTKEKLIEIPTARIKSLLKKADSITLLSGDRMGDGTRYVAIRSKKNDIALSLTQIFKTI